jgi:hypothetical protein
MQERTRNKQDAEMVTQPEKSDYVQKSLTQHGEQTSPSQKPRYRWIASFLGFTQPKTALPPWTERGLTSEFGMGSGGSRALWPATRNN